MLPYVKDRAMIDTAQELVALFGDLAPLEAEARAHHSRSIGNASAFCRWRGIGRLISLLTEEPEDVTLH
jgi:hypothetical protein